jgi:hypothetical protein
MHRNPAKHGLVLAPEQWVWSSYRHYAFARTGSGPGERVAESRVEGAKDFLMQAASCPAFENREGGPSPPKLSGSFIVRGGRPGTYIGGSLDQHNLHDYVQV